MAKKILTPAGPTPAIPGFKETWTTVQSIRDPQGDVTGWGFVCGCGYDRAFMIRRHPDAYSAAATLASKHRCPSVNVAKVA